MLCAVVGKLPEESREVVETERNAGVRSEEKEGSAGPV